MVTTAPVSVMQSFVVKPISQSLKFPSIRAMTYALGATVTLNATSSANLSPITYTSSNESVATVSNNVVTVAGIGTTLITATQAGDETHAPVSASQPLTVR